MKRNVLRLAALSSGVAILIASCAPVASPTIEVSASIVPTATSTLQPTATSTRVVVTPPPTSIPTLEPEIAAATVAALLETNNGCELPCWWGIVPGETTWEEALSLVTTFDGTIQDLVPADDEGLNYIRVGIPFRATNGELMLLSQSYGVRNGIVEIIEASAGDFPNYSLSSLLAKLGKPSEIRIKTSSPVFAELFMYDLFYPEKGVLALYVGQATLVNETVVACPAIHVWPGFKFWDPPNGPTSFWEGRASGELFPVNPNDNPETYLSIDLIAGLTIEEFYEIYLNPEAKECFTSPREYWSETEW